MVADGARTVPPSPSQGVTRCATGATAQAALACRQGGNAAVCWGGRLFGNSACAACNGMLSPKDVQKPDADGSCPAALAVSTCPPGTSDDAATLCKTSRGRQVCAGGIMYQNAACATCHGASAPYDTALADGSCPTAEPPACAAGASADYVRMCQYGAAQKVCFKEKVYPNAGCALCNGEQPAGGRAGTGPGYPAATPPTPLPPPTPNQRPCCNQLLSRTYVVR